MPTHNHPPNQPAWMLFLWLDKTGQGSIRHACQHNVEIGLEID